MLAYRTPAAAVASLLLLLAVAPTSTLAQVEGAACGPTFAGGNKGKWVRIPASKLIATGPTGPVTADSSGCVTSDNGYAANVHVYLSAGTWSIYNITARLRAARASPAAMSILVGDADVPTVMKTLRSAGGANKLSTVLKHFTTCATRRMSTLASAMPSAQSFDCDLSKTDSTGQYFGFVAPGLTVCDVMVCARLNIFSSHGVPLTRSAALMLTDAVLLPTVQGGGSDSDASAAAAVTPALANSCPGYTTSNYQACPVDKECTRTYMPGHDVCSCFSCSVFTSRRSCEQGDIIVGSESCCFGCPDQPICGVCQPPCQKQFNRIEVIVGTLPDSPENYTILQTSYDSTTSAVNLEQYDQFIGATFTFYETLTATMTYDKEFAYSENATVEIGIPFLNQADVEFTATRKFTTTTTNTATRTDLIGLAVPLPALTAQLVSVKITAIMITVKVPIKVHTYYTCNTTTEHNHAIIQTQGVLTTVDSELVSITLGPQYPVNPPVAYGQANQTCQSNPYCNEAGLQGNCCPNDNGAYYDCCSFCWLKPACDEYAETETTMCCPAMNTTKNPCCG